MKPDSLEKFIYRISRGEETEKNSFVADDLEVSWIFSGKLYFRVPLFDYLFSFPVQRGFIFSVSLSLIKELDTTQFKKWVLSNLL